MQFDITPYKSENGVIVPKLESGPGGILMQPGRRDQIERERQEERMRASMMSPFLIMSCEPNISSRIMKDNWLPVASSMSSEIASLSERLARSVSPPENLSIEYLSPASRRNIS